MNLIPEKKLDTEDYYGFIAPRPTVCVSTIDDEGNPNLAPYSFVTPVAFDPPLLAISSGYEKNTLQNARNTKEFVIVPLTKNWMEKGVKTEVSLPREKSEFEAVGLTEKEAYKVAPYHVAEAPVNIECEYWDECSGEDHSLLIGKVIHISAKDEAIKNGRLNLEEFGSVCHIVGEEFSVVDSMKKIERD